MGGAKGWKEMRKVSTQGTEWKEHSLESGYPPPHGDRCLPTLRSLVSVLLHPSLALELVPCPPASPRAEGTAPAPHPFQQSTA